MTFFNFIYGYHTTVWNDHSPLTSIVNKNFDKVISNRLQKTKLKYLIFDLEVTYLPGKDMQIANLLLRNNIHTIYKNEICMPGVVHAIDYR